MTQGIEKVELSSDEIGTYVRIYTANEEHLFVSAYLCNWKIIDNNLLVLFLTLTDFFMQSNFEDILCAKK